MIGHQRLVALFALPLALASGCAATVTPTMQEALLVSLSDAQKARLETQISQWFGGTAVRLANNAFTQSSTLTIERRTHTDSRGLPVEGRHDNPAFAITLLKQGEVCLLRNDNSGEQVALKDVDCVVVDEQSR